MSRDAQGWLYMYIYAYIACTFFPTPAPQANNILAPPPSYICPDWDLGADPRVTQLGGLVSPRARIYVSPRPRIYTYLACQPRAVQPPGGLSFAQYRAWRVSLSHVVLLRVRVRVSAGAGVWVRVRVRAEAGARARVRLDGAHARARWVVVLGRVHPHARLG